MVQQYAARTYAFKLINQFVITWKFIEEDSNHTKHWSEQTVLVRGFCRNALLFRTPMTFPHLRAHLLIRLHSWVFSCKHISRTRQQRVRLRTWGFVLRKGFFMSQWCRAELGRHDHVPNHFLLHQGHVRPRCPSSVSQLSLSMDLNSCLDIRHTN